MLRLDMDTGATGVEGDSDLWTIYVRLWGRAEGAGVYVRYVGFVAQLGERGAFDPHDHDGGIQPPTIDVVRPHYPEPSYAPSIPPDLFMELCTLAHEVGHLRSWQQGGHTIAYREALCAFNNGESLVVAQQENILNEERSAWELGSRELRSLGFKEWTRFKGHERGGLLEYEERFRGRTQQ